MKVLNGFTKLLRSLQWKLVYIFVSMCIILVSVVYVVINSGVQDIYFDSFRADMDAGYERWIEWYKEIPESNEEILAYFQDSGDDKRFFGINSGLLGMTVIDMSRKNMPAMEIIYSSDTNYKNNPESFVNELLVSSTKNLLPIYAGKKPVENRDLVETRTGNKYFEYVIQPEDRPEIIFYFTYQKEGWEDILGDFNRLILFSAIIAVFLSLTLGYLLSKTITSPIENVMHKAQKVAEGDFDVQLSVKSEDEIGNLTKTFNYMAKELKNTLSEISSEKNKVEMILNYMADGVMAFDLKGRAIHTNPAAKKLLGADVENRHFDEFSKCLGLDISLENIIYFETLPVREADTVIDNMFVKVYFAVFTDTNKKPEGIIVVLHDVTEQQKLDSMRREFVANVSHELRTPITSIKSYTETLLDGAVEDSETTERFLNVINSEADRMTRLVKDLLQLSRLDNQQMNWNIKNNISLTTMVKDIVERMQMEAARKQQKLESFVIGDIPHIRADKDRLEQVLVNVINNALKYTPEQGNITVYVGKMYNEVYVKVTDTGIGIPSESLSFVFERFYRVDKARSRDLGGTGLGLAIAREIVEAHGGSINISSEFGKGTEVTVRLPIVV